MFRVCLLLREIYHLILDSVLLLFTYKFNLNRKSLKAACSFKRIFCSFLGEIFLKVLQKHLIVYCLVSFLYQMVCEMCTVCANEDQFFVITYYLRKRLRLPKLKMFYLSDITLNGQQCFNHFVWNSLMWYFYVILSTWSLVLTNVWFRSKSFNLFWYLYFLD